MSDIPLALLAADTDRTQAYVFESARLPEIRGASWKLDDLNRQIEQMVNDAIQEAPSPPCQVVYAGGGGLLAIVPQSQAEVLARKIEALYPQETIMATITAAWRPITEAMLEGGYPPDQDAPFGALVRWAGTWLRRRKESKPVVPFIPALPYAERCASCQQRPANPQTLSWTQGPLCDVCRTKRDFAHRDYWFAQVREAVGHPEADAPRTLGEIGRACRARTGYVGFIYLDGDGLGQVLETLPKAKDYTTFSEAVEKSARGAVFDALRRLSPVKVEGDKEVREPGTGCVTIHPFEILTIGGDDVMLIVPADQAIPVACDISQGFETRMREQLSTSEANESYTLSGGIVMADDHNPVRFLRNLAEQLQDIAKAARQKVAVNQSYLDFLVLTSGDMAEQNVQRLRQHYPYTLDGPPTLRLGMRPYRAETLQVLWEGLNDLYQKGFPNRQMSQLADALLSGRREATLFYLYQKARDEHYLPLDQLLRKVQQPDNNEDPLPWIRSEQKEEHDFATALWDIVELYSFAHRRKEGA